MQQQQTPPHSEPAERAILGCVLAAAERFLPDLITLEIDDFFIPAHRELWACVKALWARQVPIDLVSLANEIEVRGTSAQFPAQPADWLVALASDAAYWEHVASHRGLVESKSALRRTIKLCTEVISEAYHAESTPNVISSLRNGLISVEATGRSDGPKTLDRAIAGALDSIRERAENPAQHSLTSGLASFDAEIGRLRPGQLIVIGGLPGMGKSAAGLGTAVANAKDGVPTFLVSLEMGVSEIAERVISRETKIAATRLTSGDAARSRDVWGKVLSGAEQARPYPLWVEDHAYKITHIAAAIRRWHMQHVFCAKQPTGVVVVDYLQLISPAGKHDRRDLEIAAMTREFKMMAMDLGIVMVVLSQLNRQVTSRGGEPILSDLRESGAIEQDADRVIFPWREDMHSSDATWICAKHRGGPCGKVRCTWDGPTMSFIDSGLYLENDPQAQQRML